MAETARPALVLALLLAGTVLGIAGTDLILPGVPALPGALGGTAAAAQLVLAAFVAGAGLGLLLFGELGARFDQRLLLAGSLALYAATSAAAAWAPSLDALIVLRFVQGAAGSAAAVFAPGFIRALYDHQGAMRAIGLLSSIESLVPAFAPLLGIWLLRLWGWRSSFILLACLSLALALLIAAMRSRLPRVEQAPSARGYKALLRDPVYLRYALSHAFTLGGLLTFVFGAPAVIVTTMGGTLADFAVMQVTGIAFFIAAANLARRVSARIGAERTIFHGTLLSAAGGCGILLYALLGGRDPLLLAALFVPMNLGLGLRGPPGFLQAIVAAQGDDARGAALLVLFILLTAATGTALAAPFITSGLPALAAVAAAISLAALLCLLALPKLDQAGSSSAETVSSIQPPPSTRSPS